MLGVDGMLSFVMECLQLCDVKKYIVVIYYIIIHKIRKRKGKILTKN